MTAVSEETPIAISIANGVTTSFPHAFTVLAAGDLYVTGELSGVKTTYVYGADYTLTGVGTSAGSVEFVVAPANGVMVTRFRVSSLARQIDYQNNGDLLAATLNLDFNRLWLAIQEAIFGSRGSATAIRAPDGEIIPALDDASNRALKTLTFDADGAPVCTSPADGSAASLASSLVDKTQPNTGGGQVYVDVVANAYPMDSVGFYLKSIGVFARAALKMLHDGTDGANNLAKLNAATSAGYKVLCEPGLFALTGNPTLVDGCGIVGAGAHWDRRAGYDYDPTRQTIFVYTGAGGSNSCVINMSQLAVGTQGTDFTTPGTDDLVDVVLKDFHVDCANLAQIGVNVYRSGNGSYIGNVTVEKAKRRGFVITGCFAAEFGILASYACERHGFDVGNDYFAWGTSEGACFNLKATFIGVGNGTDATYIKGTGTDLDDSGGIFYPGRGSSITLWMESNVGRAAILGQYNQANVAGGTTVVNMPYIEANGDGAYIDYRTATDGFRITTGFIHPGSASLQPQDFKIEAKTNAGVVTANEGPPNSTEWISFDNLQGNLYKKGFAIDSNTYKFKVRDCDSGVRFPARRPQPEGVFGLGLFKADATLSDTRYIKGQSITDSFSGDGVTADFTLSQAPTSAALTEVYVNAVQKTATTQYTITGTTLHFTAGNEPANGTTVVARYSNMKLSRTAAGRYQVDFGEDQPDVEYDVTLTAIQTVGSAMPYVRTKATTGFEIDTVDPTVPGTPADTGAFLSFKVSRVVDLP